MLASLFTSPREAFRRSAATLARAVLLPASHASAAAIDPAPRRSARVADGAETRTIASRELVFLTGAVYLVLRLRSSAARVRRPAGSPRLTFGFANVGGERAAPRARRLQPVRSVGAQPHRHGAARSGGPRTSLSSATSAQDLCVTPRIEQGERACWAGSPARQLTCSNVPHRAHERGRRPSGRARRGRDSRRARVRAAVEESGFSHCHVVHFARGPHPLIYCRVLRLTSLRRSRSIPASRGSNNFAPPNSDQAHFNRDFRGSPASLQ